MFGGGPFLEKVAGELAAIVKGGGRMKTGRRGGAPRAKSAPKDPKPRATKPKDPKSKPKADRPKPAKARSSKAKP